MNQISILNYHGVETAQSRYDWRREELTYVLQFEILRDQLALIAAHGYQTIGLADLDQWLDGRPEPKRIVLTFDDGHLSHYRYVMPELKKRNMTAIFFIPVALVGQDGHMDWDQLKELSRYGFDIGSHGMSHQPLSDMTHHELWKEMQKSKALLEERLGTSINSFSVPRGYYQDRIREVALELGYKFVFTSRFDVNGPSQDRLHMNRITVTRFVSRRQFENFVKGELGIKREIERLKELARRYTTPSFYDALAAFKRFMKGI